MRLVIVSALIGLVVGCTTGGERGRTDAGRDGGMGGGDGGADAGLPDGVYRMQLRFLDPDDNPIEAVKHGVDTDMGRFEAISDAAGEITLDIEYRDDLFSGISAKEGYTIAAAVDYTFAELPGLDLEMDGDFRIVRLGLMNPDSGVLARLAVAATGVPAGGRWCSGTGAWFTQCFAEGASYNQSIDRATLDRLLSDHLTGFAFDAAGALVDFEEATWTEASDGSRVVTIAFDGTFDTPPTSRDVTLMLPADGASRFLIDDLDTDWQGWIAAVEPGSHVSRAALTNVQIMVDRVTMTLNTFPVTGDELVWAVAAYADYSEPVRTFHWYSAPPTGDTFDFLDGPRVMLGDTYDAEIRWSEPAADVEAYFVQYLNNANRLTINLRTRGTAARLPALPTGYDRSFSFPFEGAAGDVRVVAVRGTLPPDDSATDPYRVDGEAATGPRSPITF